MVSGVGVWGFGCRGFGFRAAWLLGRCSSQVLQRPLQGLQEGLGFRT